MSQEKVAPPATPLTGMQWLVCIIAAIGFAFDIYELLMLPLIVKPAIAALGPKTFGVAADWAIGGPNYVHWARTLFFVPAIAGGVFGLLGGYLTDRLGRRTVLTYSILMYAIGACAAGFSQNLYHLLFFRCLVFIGVCVEFVAAVAWLAELFPNPTQRESVLGYTQAFSSLGGVMVAGASWLASEYANLLPAIYQAHEAWRYTLISGLIPAIPLIVIRPFLPESPAWKQKRESGTLKRPSIRELFSPALRRTTVLTTLAFATTFGLAFGAIQQTPQILANHVDVAAQVSTAQATAKEKDAKSEKPRDEKGIEVLMRVVKGNTTDKITSNVQFWQEIGGMAGRLLLAFLAIRILSRRALFRFFQLPSLVFVPVLYWWLSQNLQTAGSLQILRYGMFMAGVLVVGQMSFWGNYIPLVFPVHLRGTGESFAANIGGRVLGTAGAWITLTLTPYTKNMALTAAGVALSYAVIGAILTPMLPEPGPEGHD
jgi:MFS family permease